MLLIAESHLTLGNLEQALHIICMAFQRDPTDS